MGLTSSSVQKNTHNIDLQAAKDCIDEIDSVISRLELYKKNLRYQRDNFDLIWESGAATTFKSKFTDLIDNLEININEMKSIRKDIYSVLQSLDEPIVPSESMLYVAKRQ